jgi:mono/diheme cytochrome c family protein
MNRLLLCGVCVVTIAVAMSADTVSAQAKPAAVTKAEAVALYNTHCQICHGAGGTGSPLMAGSAFVGRKWKHGTTPQAIVKTITNGVPQTAMLPFKGRLTPEEIAAVATLVRSYDKKLKPVSAKKK